MLALGSLKRRFDSDSDSDSEVDSDPETGEEIVINHNGLKRFKLFFILKSVLSLEGDSQLPSFSRRIGNQQRPQGRPPDNHDFGGLHQHGEIAMLHQVPADDASDYDHHPDD